MAARAGVKAETIGADPTAPGITGAA